MEKKIIFALTILTLPLFFLFQNMGSPGLCSASSKDLKLLNTEQALVVKGYGCNSLGGLGGKSCIVTSNNDDPNNILPGTLRYCMEKKGLTKDTPITVTFDKSLAGQSIRLEKPIKVNSFTTLDGRMPAGFVAVTITNKLSVKFNPCHPDAEKNGYYTSRQILSYKSGLCSDTDQGNPGLKHELKGQRSIYVWNTNLGGQINLFEVGDPQSLNSVSQVIISDLILKAELPPKLPMSKEATQGIRGDFNNPCFVGNTVSRGKRPDKDPVSGRSIAYSRYVTGCPVLIDIGGNDPFAKNKVTDVVIANNDFSMCGNKCLRGNGSSDRVSVLGNRFHDTYFASLILMKTDKKISFFTKPDFVKPSEVRYTFYGNHFERVTRRSPRCGMYVQCHLFGNIISHWGSSGQSGFGISAVAGAKVIAEWNFFEAPESYDNNNPALEIHKVKVKDPVTGSESMMTDYIKLDDKNGYWTDPAEFYLGNFRIVKKGEIQYGNEGKNLQIYGELSQVRPFSPENDYVAKPEILSIETFHKIVKSAGPRKLK